MNPKKTTGAHLEISPLSLLRAVWKRKISMVVIWAVIAIITAVIVRRLPPVYAAEALILVDSQKIPEKFVASTVSSDVQDRLATISQLIMSSGRLKKIIDDYNLYGEQRKDHVQEEILDLMRKDISITIERGWTGNRPGAFRIAYKGTDPAIVAQVTNRIANFLIEENLKTRSVQAEGTSEFIDTQLTESKKRLDELEGAVSEYKLKHNGQLPQQENAISGVLVRLQLELQSNREALTRITDSKLFLDNALSMAQASARASAPETGRPGDPAGAPSALPERADPTAVKLQALEAELDKLRLTFTEEHPDVKLIKEQIAAIRAKQEVDLRAAASQKPAPAPTVAATKQPAVGVTARQLTESLSAAERVANLKAQIVIADRDIEQRRLDEQRILRDMNAAEARLEQLPVREQELSKISRDYEITKANYKSLLDKKFSAEMARDMELRQQSENFSILDPARVPEKPVQPNRPMLTWFGVLAGFVVGLVVCVGSELRNNVVLGEWELPAGVPILGRLPYIDVIVAPPPPDEPRGKLKMLLGRKSGRIAALASALFSLLVIAVGFLYFRSRS